jgi:hypothetical protein
MELPIMVPPKPEPEPATFPADDVDDDTAAPGLLDRLVESMKTWTQVEENPDVDDPDPII